MYHIPLDIKKDKLVRVISCKRNWHFNNSLRWRNATNFFSHLNYEWLCLKSYSDSTVYRIMIVQMFVEVVQKVYAPRSRET